MIQLCRPAAGRFRAALAATPSRIRMPPCSMPCAGDRIAYEVLVRQHGPHLLAVARRILKCEQDCADAVQEAFVSAFQAIHQFMRQLQNCHLAAPDCGQRLPDEAAIERPASDRLGGGSGRSLTRRGIWSPPSNPGSSSRAIWSLAPRYATRCDRVSIRCQTRTEPCCCCATLRNWTPSKQPLLLGVSVAVVKTRLHRARQALRTLLEPFFAAERV